MSNGSEPARASRLPGIGAVLCAYGLLVLGFFSVGVGAQTENIVWGLWITEAFAIALPALAWLRGVGAGWKDALGFRWPEAKWLGIAAVTAFLNQPVVSMLTYLGQQVLPANLVLEFEQKNQSLDGFFAAHPWSMLAAVAISAPLGEEIFFRGFALPAAARSMNALGAAWITALLFSGMHFDAVGALGLFEIGLWLAVLRWGSGSIVPAMLGHGLNNAIAGIWFLLGLQSSGRAPPAWAVSLGIDNPDAPPPEWVLVSGVLLLLVGAWLGTRVLTRPSPGELRESGEFTEAPPPFRVRGWHLWTVWGIAVILGALKVLKILGRA